MKIIETLNYIKLAQAVYTPEIEDQFLEQKDQFGRQHRDFWNEEKGPRRGRRQRGGRLSVRDSIEKIDPDMSDKEWKELLLRTLKQQEEKEQEFSTVTF
jgi:hypothetical protein